MEQQQYQYRAWEQAGLPVVTGPAPVGTYTLAALADPSTCAQLLPAMIDLTGAKRQAALTILHYACYTVSTLLIDPIFIDGVALDAAPDQLGAVLDPQASMVALWAGQIEHHLAMPDVTQISARLLELLAPVGAATRQIGKVSPYGVTHLTLDALIAHCRSTTRTNAVDTSLLIAALVAAGPAHYQLARPLTTFPDEGPPVVLYVPKICCVLNKEPSPHACPTCPRYPNDAARVAASNDWLRSLSNTDFQAITGRARTHATLGQPPIDS